jgi:hypothetical protein
MESNERQTLVALEQSVAKVGDLLEVFLKDWRRTSQSLGKDIDEVPTIIRLDLEKLARALEGVIKIAVSAESRKSLDRLHRILSKSRHDLWMAKQASEEGETEAAHAIRRAVDFVRDSVRAELELEPEALIEPQTPGVRTLKKRDEDDTGVHMVYEGKTVAKVKAEVIWKWAKRVTIWVSLVAVPAASAWVTNHFLHKGP